MNACEMRAHADAGEVVEAVGRFQVYDLDFMMATMSRPAFLCQGCVDFAKECGMDPREELPPRCGVCGADLVVEDTRYVCTSCGSAVVAQQPVGAR